MRPGERSAGEATQVALRRLACLVAPAGTLGLVGFARMRVRDAPWAVSSSVALIGANLVRRKWEHSAPQVWPPPFDYRELRRAADAAIPGARLSWLLLGRWLLVWQAPAAG